MTKQIWGRRAAASSVASVHLHPLEKYVRDRCSSSAALKPLLLCEAHKLFDNLVPLIKGTTPSTLICTFTMLFQAILKSTKQPKLVLTLYNRMMMLSFGRISPTHVTYGVLVKSCCCIPDIDLGFAYFGNMLKRGENPPNLVIFNTLVDGLSSISRFNEATNLVRKMEALGYSPNIITYESLVKGACRCGDLEVALQMLKMLGSNKNTNCSPDVEVYNMIIDELCQERQTDRALKLFEEMGENQVAPDIVTYHSLIHGYYKEGCWKKANEVFKRMTSQGFRPDEVTLNIFLDILCKQGKMEVAQKRISSMEQIGVVPNVVSYNTLMHGYCVLHRMEDALVIFESITLKGLVPDIYSYNILINGYCKNTKVDEALAWLKKTYTLSLQPNVFTYDPIIHELSRVGRVDEAKVLLGEMIDRGLPVNDISYIVLHNLFNIGRVADAKKLYIALEARGEILHREDCNVILNGLLVNGCQEDARDFFVSIAMDRRCVTK